MMDRTALITGGSRGIGLAIAQNLAGYGCKIIICARDTSQLENVYYHMKTYGQEITAIKCDVSKPEDIKTVMDQITDLDILINNVGGGGRWGSTFEATPIDVWNEVMQRNLGAAVSFTQRATLLMRKKNWGRVINITSIYGKEGGGKPWFTAAKAAQVAMMKCLACSDEFKGSGITFNSVAPGVIEIDGKECDRSGTVGSVKDVAAVVSFLCSDGAAHVNGAQIVVDGGQTRSF